MNRNIADTVVDEILPDGIEAFQTDRNLQLGSHAVHARHEQTFGIHPGNRRDAGKTADVGDHVRSEGGGNSSPDATDGFLPGVDIDPCVAVTRGRGHDAW